MVLVLFLFLFREEGMEWRRAILQTLDVLPLDMEGGGQNNVRAMGKLRGCEERHLGQSFSETKGQPAGRIVRLARVSCAP